MSSLNEIDRQNNKIIDVNSMMSAFDNYLQQVTNGDEIIGAPIRCYIKKLSKNQIIKLWLNKNAPKINTPTNQEKDSNNSK